MMEFLYTICKQSAPRSRQITTPTPHHSNFYRPDAFPDTQPTMSKHTRTHTHTHTEETDYTESNVKLLQEIRQQAE